MYKMIGADSKMYGPVTVAQLRQWITEGRANAHTQVQPDGATDWKPISAFPELADHFALHPPSATPPMASGSKAPGAEKKIVAGICAIMLGTLGVHKFILGYTTEGVIMLLVTVLTCGIGGAVMWVIGLIEGITYLTKSDDDFVATYIVGKKGWL